MVHTKIPVIPPLLENNKLITDFKLKVNLFHDSFNHQCTTVYNLNSVPENLNFESEKRLSIFEICNGDIVKFIRSLDPNKARSQNGILFRMLKLCATSFIYTTTNSLQILFE